MRHEPKRKRYQILDALRGFALVGVIIVNAGTINGPFWMDEFDFAFQNSKWDSLVTKFSFAFLVKKFYPLFVLLFGLSASLMIEIFNNRFLSANRCFLKRISLLALFGFLHIMLFFWGDVILVYAFLGVILLAISNLGHKNITIITLTLFLLTIVFNLLIYILGLPEDNYDNLMVSVYGAGSFLDIMIQRLLDYYELYYWGFFQTDNIVYAFDYGVYYIELLAFMTLGFVIGKYKEYFDKVDLYVHLLLKAIIFSSLGIFLLNCGKFMSIEWMEVFSPIEKLLFVLLYSSGFCLLYLKMGPRLRRSFSSAGRMTLTWYLFFSLLMSFILYGYGFGLYGKIGPSIAVGIGIIYLLICLLLSPIWLQKFGMGPMEKIWRTFAYSNLQSSK